MIAPILRGEATEVEIKKDADKTYVDWVQTALKKTIFQRELCESWYTDEKGWNGTTYPRSQLHFTWRSTFPTWSDWYFKPTKYGVWMKRIRKALAVMMIFGVVGVGALFRRGDLSVEIVKKWTRTAIEEGKNVLVKGLSRITG